MGGAGPVLAHVGGGDLPLPLWQFVYGGLALLAAAFLALRSSWPQARFPAAAVGRPLPRAVDSAASIGGLVLRALGVVLWVVALTAAWFGTDNARENLAPNLVWVVLWAGMQVVSAVLGDVWRALSPFDTIAAIAHSVRTRRRPGPARQARDDGTFATSHWLAAAGVLGFAWLELCYHSPDKPRVLAIVITGYSVVMFAGAARFGRNWLRTSEMFAVVFGLFAAMAPFFRDDDGRLRIRAPLVGLAAVRARAGTVAVVVALIAATGFDGVASTQWWTDILGDSRGWGRTLVNSLGLAAVAAIVLAAYVAAARASVPGTTGPRRFVAALVPIALGYAIAHYFSLFVVEGQATLPLVSDPFGEGWDLFGFGSPQPDVGIVSPTTTVWVQALAIAAGHVAGLAVALDRAADDEATGLARARTVYPLLFTLLASITGGYVLMLG